jgi:hypothetical protein
MEKFVAEVIKSRLVKNVFGSIGMSIKPIKDIPKEVPIKIFDGFYRILGGFNIIVDGYPIEGDEPEDDNGIFKFRNRKLEE